jgi:hypothetical protein
MYEFKATIPDGCKVLEAYSVSHGSDLDQLQDGWVQYKQSQEYEDYYRVECVRNIEIRIVLSASIILKIVGSLTQRIDSSNLSIFHFLFPS